jgi:hypothetical protein
MWWRQDTLRGDSCALYELVAIDFTITTGYSLVKRSNVPRRFGAGRQICRGDPDGKSGGCVCAERSSSSVDTRGDAVRVGEKIVDFTV